MIPQIVQYFRFQTYSDNNNNTYIAPPRFSTGSDYYAGYNMAPYTLSYNIHRSIDIQPDTFSVIVDSYFFENPTSNPLYMSGVTTKVPDPANSFQPSVNDVVVIGPIPSKAKEWGEMVNGSFVATLATETFSYEDDEPLISSPIFGLVTSWTNLTGPKMQINCTSFLKVLDTFQLPTTYVLNNHQDGLNDLQIYYEYDDSDINNSSAPYFAPVDSKSVSNSGIYRISPAVALTDENDYPPYYPRFSLFTGSYLFGYETPKIAWRLLQELGWCRKNYLYEPIYDLGATIIDDSIQLAAGNINPYQDFYLETASDFKPSIMTGTYTNFSFTAFDTDGLRFEFPADSRLIETESDLITASCSVEYNGHVMSDYPTSYDGFTFDYLMESFYTSSPTDKREIYITFDLSNVPSDAIIESATMYLYQNSARYGTGNNYVRRVVQSWTAPINYNTRPSSTSPSLTFVPLASAGWIGLDVGTDVRMFVEQGVSNYGWQIATTETGVNYIGALYYSSRYSNAALHPYLSISYRLPVTVAQMEYRETFLDSFDPSRQSVLYNLKTLAESDGLYMAVTCNPRFEKVPNINTTQIVWDYSKVYGNLDNLKRWGIAAGFRPKVLIKKNTPQSFGLSLLTSTQAAEFLDTSSVLLTGTILYGAFNNNPSVNSGTGVALVTKINWQSDQTDVINKLLIKYGQGSTSAQNYLALPQPTIMDDYFVITFDGDVENSSAIINLSIMYVDEVGNVQTDLYSRTYPVGAKDYEIVNDFYNSYNFNALNSYYMLASGSSLLVIPTKITDEDTPTSVLWTGSAYSDPPVKLIITYLGSTGKNLGVLTEFFAEEPFGFSIARDSQKVNGIMSQPIALPEVNSFADVVNISSDIFKKLAQPRFRCITSLNVVDNWYPPLFGLYHIKDVSNTKQVINTEGASVIFYISGTVTLFSGTHAFINTALPMPDSTYPIDVITMIDATYTVSEILDSIQSNFEALELGSGISSSVDYSLNSITFTYELEYIDNADYKNPVSFNQATMTADCKGLEINRITNPPAVFKKVAYDEYLILTAYDAASSSSQVSCTFGVAPEELSNVINQSMTWTADVQKSQ
jgi:hypothetical protein